MLELFSITGILVLSFWIGYNTGKETEENKLNEYIRAVNKTVTEYEKNDKISNS